MALPLLILFILHLASCLEMLRLHGRLEYALWQTGRELAVYGAAETAGDIPDLAVSYLYVNGRLEQILGGDYLDNAPLAHGRQGLNYLSSRYLEEEQCIDILLTYQVCPPITCFPFPYFRMASRYYGRAWTGYDVGGEEGRIFYVYVTADGEVWHSRGDCSYLKPSVSETLPETVWSLRNASGERYRSCSRCRDLPTGDTVYLTREGNRYHNTRGCPALLRRALQPLRGTTRYIEKRADVAIRLTQKENPRCVKKRQGEGGSGMPLNMPEQYGKDRGPE